MATQLQRRKPFFKRKLRALSGEEAQIRAQRKQERMNRMKRGIFILPSLLTLASIFLSFYAMICAVKHEFALAAALIIGAGVFDGIDGKVARWTKTTTRFGVELDSLADVISFGVAPALLMYIWALEPYGRIAWVTAFIFVSCGALRLARFNVQTGSIDPKRFNGLPIPAAAAMIATTVLFFYRYEISPDNFGPLLIAVTLILAFFMVSTVKFHAFKDLTVVKEKPFSTTVAFVLLLALLALLPFLLPFLICAGYVLHGPFLTIYLSRRERKERTKPTGIQDPPELPVESSESASKDT
jgi:CDP-diacylglycerol---serine O-phosphatidyltransferase